MRTAALGPARPAAGAVGQAPLENPPPPAASSPAGKPSSKQGLPAGSASTSRFDPPTSHGERLKACKPVVAGVDVQRFGVAWGRQAPRGADRREGLTEGHGCGQWRRGVVRARACGLRSPRRCGRQGGTEFFALCFSSQAVRFAAERGRGGSPAARKAGCSRGRPVARRKCMLRAGRRRQRGRPASGRAPGCPALNPQKPGGTAAEIHTPQPAGRAPRPQTGPQGVVGAVRRAGENGGAATRPRGARQGGEQRGWGPRKCRPGQCRPAQAPGATAAPRRPLERGTRGAAGAPRGQAGGRREKGVAAAGVREPAGAAPRAV
jgi:hypothetical protein